MAKLENCLTGPLNADHSKGLSLSDGNLLLEPGTYLIHPLHGIGCVEQFEDKEVLGQKCRFAVISFQNDKLRMLVNVNKKDSMLRKLISNEDIPVLLDYIKTFESDIPVKSAERYNLNMKKIKSTDVLLLAQVIKDLSSLGKTKKLTPKELDMLKQTKKTLAVEFAFVSSLSLEDAEHMVEESCRIA